MSRWEKLIEKLYSLDQDLRFEELQKILEYYGYALHRPSGGSSHFTFRKRGADPITIPRHKPIKRVYIELVKNMVEEETKHEEH